MRGPADGDECVKGKGPEPPEVLEPDVVGTELRDDGTGKEYPVEDALVEDDTALADDEVLPLLVRVVCGTPVPELDGDVREAEPEIDELVKGETELAPEDDVVNVMELDNDDTDPEGVLEPVALVLLENCPLDVPVTVVTPNELLVGLEAPELALVTELGMAEEVGPVLASFEDDRAEDPEAELDVKVG